MMQRIIAWLKDNTSPQTGTVSMRPSFAGPNCIILELNNKSIELDSDGTWYFYGNVLRGKTN